MTPRDETKAREKLLADCKRPAFARLARYTKPNDDGSGDTFTRASIKFVETALARWGNVRTQNITTTDTEKTRTVRVVITDMEGGSEYSKDLLLEKVAERVKVAAREKILGTRMTADGQVFLVPATEDDLAAKEAQLASIVVRQLGLRILPADLVAECMDAVAETMDEGTAGFTSEVIGKIADGLKIPASEIEKGQAYIDPRVHPQESRSSALAGLLKQRKGKTPTKTPAAPQSTAQSAGIPTEICEHCALPIFRQRKRGKGAGPWAHTNGQRKCAGTNRTAKPRKVGQ